MADKELLSQMLEHLVNENQEKAEELFHDYVVAKSREIYESLIEEEMEEEVDEATEEKEEAVDEATDEEVEESSDDEKLMNQLTKKLKSQATKKSKKVLKISLLKQTTKWMQIWAATLLMT